MDAKDAISKIKVMLGLAAAPSGKTGNHVKTSDGMILNIIGELAPGTAVKEIGPDGETDVPDGEYTLEDGTKINLEGGLIVDIKTEGAAADKTPDKKADAKPQSSAPEISDLEKRISELEKKLGMYQEKTTKAEQKLAAQKVAFRQLVELVEQIAELPQEKPTEKPRHTLGVSRDEYADRTRQLADSLKQLSTKS